MFKTAKFTRVSHNIVQQIRDLIINGSLKPGQRLPSEQKLSEEFGVSKATLREAIRVLEALGMLDVRQGVSGGAFVREIDDEIIREHLYNYFFFQNPDIKDFTQLRSIVEPRVVEMIVDRMTDKDLAEFDDLLLRTEKKLNEDQFFFDLDNEFHHKIAKLSGNRVIVFVVDSMKAAVVNIKLKVQIPQSFYREVYNAHVRIVDAFKKKDPKAAADEMSNHIMEVEDSLVQIYGDMTLAEASV
jgi:GntR family transcriptional repressor for pyruvate dehydrogenase complex